MEKIDLFNMEKIVPSVYKVGTAVLCDIDVTPFITKNMTQIVIVFLCVLAYTFVLMAQVYLIAQAGTMSNIGQ